MTERSEQIQFFSELSRLEAMYPEMAEDFHWIYASMNGAWFKSKKMAVTALREGMTPGVWDIHWALKTEKYPGFWMEMKFGKNKLSDNQERFKAWIEKQGYFTCVAYSWLEAIKHVCEYAGLRYPYEE